MCAVDRNPAGMGSGDASILLRCLTENVPQAPEIALHCDLHQRHSLTRILLLDLVRGRAAQSGEEPVESRPAEQVVADAVIVDGRVREDIAAIESARLAGQVAHADVVAQAL